MAIGACTHDKRCANLRCQAPGPLKPIDAVEQGMLRGTIEFAARTLGHLIEVTEYFTLYPQSVLSLTGRERATDFKE